MKRSDYWHDPGPEQRFRFLLATEGIVNINQVFCEFIKAFIHHPEKDVEIMDSIENKGLVLLEIFNVLHERTGDLCIVQPRVEVMDRMISVIPAILVVYIVDTIEYTAEVAIRITLVNETVLRPVAHHHNKPAVNHWND